MSKVKWHHPIKIVPAITGVYPSDRFIKLIDDALWFLRWEAIEYYEFVCKHIQQCTIDDRSQINVRNRKFLVRAKAAESNIYWRSSIFVHDAQHVVEYLLNHPFIGRSAEAVCLQKQIDYLYRVGGPGYFINYCKRLIHEGWDGN